MKTLLKIIPALILFSITTQIAYAVAGSWDSYSPQSTTIGTGVYINGWNRDYDHSDGVLVANIYVDGNFAGQAGMSDYRSDIGGYYGWHYTIPTDGLSVGSHSIVVWLGNNSYGGWISFSQSYIQSSGVFTLSTPPTPPPTGSVSGTTNNITSSAGSYTFTAGTNLSSYSWNAIKDGSLIATSFAGNTSGIGWGYGNGSGTYQFYVGMSGPGGTANTNSVTTIVQTPSISTELLQWVSPANFTVASGANINVSGWAIDYQNGAPVPVTLYVDGVARSGAVTNGISRPDVQSASVSYGWSPYNDVTASGWTAIFNSAGLSAGAHSLYMSVSNSFAGSNSAFTVTSPTYTFTVINPAPVNVSVTVGASFAYGQPIPMTVRSTDANGDLVAQHIVVSNSSYTTNNWEGTDPSGWKWHHFMSVSTPLNGDTTSSFTLVDNNFGQGSNLPPGTYHVTLNTQDTLPNYTYDPSNVMATFTVGLAPAITSALTKDGVANVALTPTYLITATNSPTSYSASGLPAGLSVNTSTGVISGTPTGSGTTNVTISATNAYGTGSATLQITVSLSGAPVITSTLGKTGTVSMPLSPAYLITGSNAPTSYSATGLPAGLSVNTSTGAITGLPTASGVTYATISATNSYGTGSATLTFTVNSSVPDTTNSLELKIHVPTP